ncbi:unnamed protein product, partial [Discosporangium mesarthrocarpum]
QNPFQSTPSYIHEKVVDFREDVQDRVHDIKESLASMSSSFNEDYLSPITQLVQHPAVIHYSVVMSARLSYFMAQQTFVSTTVDGKRKVDIVALVRAVLAALADGREEGLLQALRIPEERITSTENYAWWSRNLRGAVDLMRQDGFGNGNQISRAISIEEGTYGLPRDMTLSAGIIYNPASMIAAFTRYYTEELNRKVREETQLSQEPQGPAFVGHGRYPEYFLANEDFLSAKKTHLMDYEMESKARSIPTNVWGMGDAMRRRSIARVSQVLTDKDLEAVSLLDVGCGTGRFLTFDNFKQLKTTALDLSLFNLQRARAVLGRRPGLTFAEANAENMPLPNDSYDIVTCNFVLSTMPTDAQINVINEMARTLKPGGKVIIVDATQPEFDGSNVCTIDQLPSWRKNSIYEAYLKSDLEYALIKAGLFVQDKEINWVSKVLVAQKPPRLSPSGSESGTGLMGVGF